MEESKVFGEVSVNAPLDARTGYSQNKPIDEVIAEAESIHEKVKKAERAAEAPDGQKRPDTKKKRRRNVLAPLSPEKRAELLRQIQDEHKDFNTTFPLVVRSIVDFGIFSKKALGLFLRHYISHKISSREDFVKMQAEYLVFLAKSTNRRYDEAKINKYREDRIKDLLDEDKKFQEAQKTAKEEADRFQQQINRARRAQLYQALRGSGPLRGSGLRPAPLKNPLESSSPMPEPSSDSVKGDEPKAVSPTKSEKSPP